MKQDHTPDIATPESERRVRRKIVKGLAGLPAMATLMSGSALGTPVAMDSSLQCIGKYSPAEGDDCLPPSQVTGAAHDGYYVGTQTNKNQALREQVQYEETICYNSESEMVDCSLTDQVDSLKTETVTKQKYCPVYVDQHGNPHSAPGDGLHQITDSCMATAAMVVMKGMDR